MRISSKQTAMKMLRRLLDGERGELPEQMSYLLDKASCLRDSDEFYRWVLPPDLASLRISPQTRSEIIAELCSEVSRHPEEALLEILAEGDYVCVRTMATILADPPRELTLQEVCTLLRILRANLPACLQDMADFIPKAELESIIQTAEHLQNIVVEEAKTDEEKIYRNGTKMYAEDLIKSLAQLGFR